MEFVKVGKILKASNPKFLVDEKTYLKSGEIPIIDQKQNLISGYVNDPIFLNTEESIIFGDHTRAIKYINFPFALGDSGAKKLIPNTHGINLKFVYFALQSLKIFSRGYSRHWIFLKEMEIPLPSLNQQQKIVNFLDKWTALINDLETEQVKRTEQFKFYLNQAFQNLKSNKIPCLNLIEVRKGKQLNKEDIFKEAEPNLYPVINGGIAPSGYWNEFNQNENQITISQGGASAGFVQWMNTKFWAGAHCYLVSIQSKNLLIKYLYFFLKGQEKKIMSLSYGGGIPALATSSIYDLLIPLPSLDEQQKISENLDKLHSLTFDFLPKEIELRKQQYKHYLNTIFQHLI